MLRKKSERQEKNGKNKKHAPRTDSRACNGDDNFHHFHGAPVGYGNNLLRFIAVNQ